MNRRMLLALGVSVFFSAQGLSAEENNASESSSQGVVVESVEDGDLVVEEEPEESESGSEVRDTSAAPEQMDEQAAESEAAASSSDELNLDELLSEEGEEDLLAEERPDETAEENETVSEAAADTSSEAAKNSAQKADQKSPSHTRSKPPKKVRTSPSGSQTPETVAVGEDTTSSELVVEEVQSINFAHNLEEYRSPKLAMLLSFLVPGLGQAYSKNYLKAGAFVAAEAAIIGAAVAFNVKGGNQQQKAQDYADEHFSVDTLEKFTDDLAEEFRIRGKEGYVDTVLPAIDSFFYASAEEKHSSFYREIRSEGFVQGWIDCEPNVGDVVSYDMTDTIDGEHGKYMRSDRDTVVEFYLVNRILDEAGRRVNQKDLIGFSSHQGEYNSMVDKSDSYYDAVKYSLYGLVINHIVSAIDAGFTAKAYNSYLLGKETVWNRLSVEQQYVFTGSETVPGVALKVKF
ncbi:MAG: DUF5683 domain-containing protein [Chitinispirillaceae bacterium]